MTSPGPAFQEWILPWESFHNANELLIKGYKSIIKFYLLGGQPSQMYVNVTRSQTDQPKLEYSAYATPQQDPVSQHLSQQTTYLSESDFGSHAIPTKEEPVSLFTISSQQQQQQTQHQQNQQSQQTQQSSLPGTSSPAESGGGTPQEPQDAPTLADYNQSTSKGHEILSQVG